MPIRPFKGFARRKSAGNLSETAYSDLSSPSQPSFRVLSRAEADGRSNAVLDTDVERPRSSPLNNVKKEFYDQGPHLSNTYGGSARQVPLHAQSPTDSSSIRDTLLNRHSYHSPGPSSVSSNPRNDLEYGYHKSNLSQNTQSLGQQQYEEPHFTPPQKPRTSVSPTRVNRFSLTRPRLVDSDSESVTGRDLSMTRISYPSSPSPNGRQKQDGEGRWTEDIIKRKRILTEAHVTFDREAVNLPLPPPPAARSELDSLSLAKKQYSWEDEEAGRPATLSNRLQKSPTPDFTPRRSWESDASDGALTSLGTPYSVRQRPVLAPLQRNTILSYSSSPVLPDSPSPTTTENQGLLDAVWASNVLDQRYAPRASDYRRLPDRSRPREEVRAAPQRGLYNQHGPRQSLQSSNAMTPKAEDFDENTPLFENERPRGELHSPKRSSIIPKNNKVMTPEQFEKYKQTAAEGRDGDDDSDKSDGAEPYEDDDETERNRQIAKQRRKQEAQLAVYRQQMMKVTGEPKHGRPASVNGRPVGFRASRSMSALPKGANSLQDPKIAQTDSNFTDDSDEDIPLGVLQAHGFPSSSRPSTRSSNRSSTSHSRSASQLSSYPAPAGSNRNDAAAGGGGNPRLPVFARNLPTDPHIGASLVNTPNRESLQSAAPPPPGGLVGVIAGEERARAMRRGSPNTSGVYGPVHPQQSSMHPHMQMQMPPYGMPPVGMGMPFMAPGQALTPAEQAQMEMNSSMQQFMQMQMQFMQQMMAMQESSAMSQHAGSDRASSMMGDDSSDGGGRAPGYAASIAPSERSNVGQPSRYRPVTPSHSGNSSANGSRTNTMSFASARSSNGWSSPRQRSRSPHKLDLPGQGLGAVPSSTIKAINKPKVGAGAGAGSDGDEDDEAWAAVKKRREERKSRWAMRKKAREAGELPKHDGSEGRSYEGS